MVLSTSQIQQKLVDTLSNIYNWTVSVLLRGLIANLLKVIAFGLSRLAYYIEFRAVENVWGRATQRRSLVAKSFEMNYDPKRATGSPGRLVLAADVTGTFPVPYSFDYTGPAVIIQKWQPFTDDQGQAIIYCTEEDTYPSGTRVRRCHLSSVARVDDTRVEFTTTTAHGFLTGDKVAIRRTAFYDGDYLVTVTSTTKFVIGAEFHVEVIPSIATATTGDLYLKIREGTPKSVTIKAGGRVRERIFVYSDKVDQNGMQVDIVDVEGTVLHPVTLVRRIFRVNDPTVYACEVTNSPDFTFVILTFGDGVRAQKLNADDLVRIQFGETKGKAGEIPNVGVISQPQGEMLDTANNPMALVVRNDEAILGGSDAESIEEIRSNGTDLYPTGGKTGSSDDWLAVLKSYDFVGDVVVWTDADTGRTGISVEQNVNRLSAITVAGEPLTQGQKETIALDLNTRKCPTDLIRWHDAVIFHIRFRIDLRLANVPLSTMEDNVFEALYARYGLARTSRADFLPRSDGTKIGFVVPPTYLEATQSQAWAIIKDVPEVVTHTTELLHAEYSEIFKDLGSILNRAFMVLADPSDNTQTIDQTTVPALQQVFIQEGTVELWIRRKIDGALQQEERIAYAETVSLGTPTGNFIEDEGPADPWRLGVKTLNYTQGTFNYQVEALVTGAVTRNDFETAVADLDVGSDAYNLEVAKYLTGTVGGGSTNGTQTVTVASTTNPKLRVGMRVTGTHIPEDSFISSVPDSTHIVLDSPTPITGSASGQTYTFYLVDPDYGREDWGVAWTADKRGIGFNILNPRDDEDNGYFMRLLYKTRSGKLSDDTYKYLDDIRLIGFNHTVTVDREDLTFVPRYIG